MTSADVLALLPLIVLGLAPIVVMLVIAMRRDHALTLALTLAGLAASLVAFILMGEEQPVTSLLMMDQYTRFYAVVLLLASMVVSILTFGYMRQATERREEFYLLLLLATFGAVVLVASTHLASFFLGLEVLSISLYAMIGYARESRSSIEAALKYLVLAAASVAVTLFGMALVYSQLGTMVFSEMAAAAAAGAASTGSGAALLLGGLAMIVVGVGFKLAVVPFHWWTADVYQGAPAPATLFIATVSKCATLALVLRLFATMQLSTYPSLFVLLSAIAIASMFVGNLLALLQRNVKRLLAYSSISHFGYVLVALLASRQQSALAATLYLVAYIITSLGTFGTVTLLSRWNAEAEDIDDYRSLFWRRPWLALVFGGMLLSLAGIPLTAGFIGKFFVVSAGVGSALWALVVTLAVTSAIGLFYYLRLMVALFTRPAGGQAPEGAAELPLGGSLILALLAALLVWLGVYPAPLIQIIQTSVAGL